MSSTAARHAAVPALVDSLIGDVFYQTILIDHASDEARRAALAHYMTYAIEEAGLVGRVVTLDDPGLGAALWLLPQAPDRQAREHETKQAFLRGLLGARGYANYAGMVRFMHARSVPLIAADAWYLSILGVAPAAQGQGLGRRLLEPTLAEAAAVGVSCWMETFTRRGARFYERSGFTLVAWHDEPTTGWPYAILRREP